MSWIPLAVGAGIGLAEFIADAIPNEAEKEAKKRLEELRAREAAGTLGLTGKEKEAWEAAMMDPVRAAEREALARQAALTSAMGQTAGGDVFRRQQAESERMAQTSREVGKALRQADVAHEAEERKEMDELIAERAVSQEQLKSQAFDTLGKLAQAYGTYASGPMGYGTTASPAGTEAYLEMGYTPDEAAELATLDEEDLAATMGRSGFMSDEDYAKALARQVGE